MDRLRQAEQAISSSGQGGDFRSAISSAESVLSQLQGEMQQLQSAKAAPQQLIQQANLAIDNAQKVMKQPQGQQNPQAFSTALQAVVRQVQDVQAKIIMANAVAPGATQGEQTPGRQAAVNVQQSAPEIRVQEQQPKVTVQEQQPKVTIEQPAPKITVEQPKPQVTVSQQKPEVIVQQAKPEVSVQQAKPEVNVQQAKPDVKVTQQGSAQVNVENPVQPEVKVQGASQQPTWNNTDNKASQAYANPQTGAPIESTPDKNTIASMKREDVVGKYLYGKNGNEVAKIEDVTAGANGTIQNVRVGVGGFLGLGERHVMVPANQLKMQGDRIVAMNMTDDQIRNLPAPQ